MAMLAAAAAYLFFAASACAASSVPLELGSSRGELAAVIKEAIDPIVQAMARKYRCAVSVALNRQGGGEEVPLLVTSAFGTADRTSGRQVERSDLFIWGSVTKLVTGAGVLQLVEKKKVALDDPIPGHIDPFLKVLASGDPKQNFTSLEELFGPEVHKVTVKDLLGMRSGIPDYDTASPQGHLPTDVLRAQSYAHPRESFPPGELLNMPWMRTGRLLFPPGTCDREKYLNCYSSSNFVLLGMLLAHHAGATSWQSYQQQDVLSAVSADFQHTLFAKEGPPAKFTPVRGYDTTHYNNNTHAIDVSQVAGVLGGWTAGDLVTDAAGAAALGQDLYGPEYKLVSKPLVDEMMAESTYTGYGLATFNLTMLTSSDLAYGHLGATYGYQSVVVFVPMLNLSIAIATNIERDHQDQPQDVFCSVYNTAKAVILGKRRPRCRFTPGYWKALCVCVDEGSDAMYI